MEKLGLYSVSDAYINFLRNDSKLVHVFDNKEDNRVHTRKYLGAVFSHNGFNYYIPFSSPKPKDYIINEDGTEKIKKDTVPIIRMTHSNSSGEKELKGTLVIGDMIPVPKSELTYYDISQETNVKYKDLVTKEYKFITANASKIIKTAKLLYKQKTRKNEIFNDEKPAPKYVDVALDFKYAESKCQEYMLSLTFHSLPPQDQQHTDQALGRESPATPPEPAI